MGTSISQGSPTSRSDAGPAWKQLKKIISDQPNPERLLDNVLGTYKAQFGDATNDLLVDDGVKHIEKMIRSFSGQGVAEFLIDGRRALSLTGSNSFLAELALTSASTAIASQSTDLHKSFITNYLSSIVDYILSRDSTAIIGSIGVPNVEAQKNLISSVYDSIASSDFRNLDLEQIVAQKLGGNNE